MKYFKQTMSDYLYISDKSSTVIDRNLSVGSLSGLSASRNLDQNPEPDLHQVTNIILITWYTRHPSIKSSGGSTLGQDGTCPGQIHLLFS